MLESYKELISAKAEIKQLKKQLEEAKPVHAYWKPFETLGELIGVMCSVCGYREYNHVKYTRFSYCPNCGAKMDKKEG